MTSYTKFKAPENCGSISIAGQTFTPDENGIATFPVELTAEAVSHGYTPIDGSGFIDGAADDAAPEAPASPSIIETITAEAEVVLGDIEDAAKDAVEKVEAIIE